MVQNREDGRQEENEGAESLRAQFLAAMEAAGVTVPPSRMEAVFAGYAELQTHIRLLRRLEVTEPPAHVFAPQRRG